MENQPDRSVAVTPLDPLQGERDLPGLIDLLEDAVRDGASVGFLAPLDRDLAAAYWRDRLAEAGRDRRVILVARDATGLVGSVQLVPALQQNGSHRAEVERLLVLTSARRRGVGTALMRTAEATALARGRTLLTLNTRTGDPPEALYTRLGYTHVGTIPDFAQNPDGTFNTTSVMFRRLAPPAPPGDKAAGG